MTVLWKWDMAESAPRKGIRYSAKDKASVVRLL